MLGIFLIYYIGKSFYQLANIYHKSPWGFAFAGLGVFYGAQISSGVLMYLFLDLGDMDSLDTRGLDFMSAIVGGGITYFFYQYLKNKWSIGPIKEANPDILDDMV